MRSLRSASIAVVTAGALALSAAPAVAQESSVGSSGSSAIGDLFDANDYERAIWGSTKDFDEVTPFGSSWYAYTIAITAAAIAGGIHAAGPAVQQFLAEQGIRF